MKVIRVSQHISFFQLHLLIVDDVRHLKWEFFILLYHSNSSFSFFPIIGCFVMKKSWAALSEKLFPFRIYNKRNTTDETVQTKCYPLFSQSWSFIELVQHPGGDDSCWLSFFFLTPILFQQLPCCWLVNFLVCNPHPRRFFFPLAWVPLDSSLDDFPGYWALLHLFGIPR